MHYLFVLTISLIALIATLIPTSASEISHELDLAIFHWLNDDDAEALPILAREARNGDELSMILLGQLANRPGELSPYLQSLDRTERVRLWKAEKGRFGESWLKQVESKSELAEALLSINDSRHRIQGGLLLLELGERGQAIRSWKRLPWELSKGEIYLLSTKNIEFPPEIAAFRWFLATLDAARKRTRPIDRQNAALIQEANLALLQSDIRGFQYLDFIAPYMSNRSKPKHVLELAKVMMNGDTHPEKGQTWEDMNALSDKAAKTIVNSPYLENVRNVCADLCPDEVQSCTRTAYTLLRGYNGVLDLQSPIEMLIPSESYFASKRFGADMIRNMDAGLLTYWIRDRPSVINKCIGRHVYNSSPGSQERFKAAHRSFLGID